MLCRGYEVEWALPPQDLDTGMLQKEGGDLTQGAKATFRGLASLVLLNSCCFSTSSSSFSCLYLLLPLFLVFWPRHL